MRKRRPNRLWMAAVAAFVVLAGILVYSFVEPFLIEIKQYEYASPDVPPEFDGTTIVLVADIHRGPFFSQERVGRLVDRVNSLDPDIVALAGDYVYANPEYMGSCFAELEGLRAPLGRFAVLGNHDYGETWRETQDAVEAIEASGIELLDNRGLWVEKDGARIRVGGVADHQVGRPEVYPTLDDTEDEDLVVLLSHNPDFAEALPSDRVDLVLSGHTHGGQLTFFGLFAPHLPSDYGQKYRTGVVEMETATVVVTNGIGSSILLPVRFFARPQIVEITLRHVAGSD